MMKRQQPSQIGGQHGERRGVHEAFSVNPGDFPDTRCESLRTNKRGLLEVVVLVNEGGIRLTHTSK